MMELPSDVAHTVMSMLKPQARPFAILIFEYLMEDTVNIRVRAGSITESERNALLLTGTQCILGMQWWARHADSQSFTSDTVYAAMALEFEFATEADRARWDRRVSFEMRRPAVHRIA